MEESKQKNRAEERFYTSVTPLWEFQPSAIRRDDHTQRLGLSCKMSTATLPLLLPPGVLGVKSESDPQEWKPSRYLQAPQPPPTDDSRRHDQEMAAARQLVDGKAFKKVRPRRTVDYFAGVGRWTLVSSRSVRVSCVISRATATQDVDESAVSAVHEASGAVYNRCMEPFGPNARLPVFH